MTDQRDFKRRVRDRQARTGESYMTARRHVLAQRPEPAIPVVETIDATDDAARLGLRCRVLVFPRLAEKIEIAALLAKVRDALLLTAEDKETQLIRELALYGRPPRRPMLWAADVAGSKRFVARVRAGMGGTTNDGHVLAIHVAGRDGIVVVMCTCWYVVAGRDPTLVLTTLDELGNELWERVP